MADPQDHGTIAVQLGSVCIPADAVPGLLIYIDERGYGSTPPCFGKTVWILASDGRHYVEHPVTHEWVYIPGDRRAT